MKFLKLFKKQKACAVFLVELWENEKCRVGTRAVGKCFHSFFEFSQTFLECFHNSTEKRRTFSISSRKHLDERRGKNVFTFLLFYFYLHQNVNSLCLRHLYVNSSCQFCVSTELQKHDFQPISGRIFLGLFSKI